MTKNAKQLLIPIIFGTIIATAYGQQLQLPTQQDRWEIQPDESISWKIDKRLPHSDHIEMSGEQVAIWVGYGLDSMGRSSFERILVFPMFRVLPVSTRSHISYTFTDSDLPRFYVNNRLLQTDLPRSGRSGNLSYVITEINHRGIMNVKANVGTPTLVTVDRAIFPSVDKPLAFEKFVFTNRTQEEMTISMEYLKHEVRTTASRSTPVPHTVIMGTLDHGDRHIAPGESTEFTVYYQATDVPADQSTINITAEAQARMARVNSFRDFLQLRTPDSVLNTMFEFAKLRGTESIYKTRGGYMHGPGGLAYYAAIWANDQAEYINPFFAFTGDSVANSSAMNAYRWFAKYMNENYKPIPSSIIAEGKSVWHGAGDRGDQAMIAYGASRYALAYGDADTAEVLWPLITWCLEYCRKNLNTEGVVTSDSDELENRFPSGEANLATNTLYYDALRSAAMLGKSLKKPKAQINRYWQEANVLKKNIDRYFGGRVEGFDTYKYYETNDVLRAWICLPLTVGIFDRKDATIDALFSPRLWTADGLATEAGKETFWDRSTLYALRGVFESGATEKGMEYLQYYSKRRLLGEHVPYAVEAYPEGNQRHLSAESGLYCRIFTEGVFGIRPTGLRSFDLTPRLPTDWNQMALNKIKAFGTVFDIAVKRLSAAQLEVNITNRGTTQTHRIKDGATLDVSF